MDIQIEYLTADDEDNFVIAQANAPLDIDEFCDSVPDELGQRVYAFSVMTIKLDTLHEAAYLGRLGAGLRRLHPAQDRSSLRRRSSSSAGTKSRVGNAGTGSPLTLRPASAASRISSFASS